MAEIAAESATTFHRILIGELETQEFTRLRGTGLGNEVARRIKPSNGAPICLKSAVITSNKG